MQKKIILLASFIDKEYLDKFLYKIYKNFGVNKKTVFVFETEQGLVLTYRIFLQLGEKNKYQKRITKNSTDT